MRLMRRIEISMTKHQIVNTLDSIDCSLDSEHSLSFKYISSGIRETLQTVKVLCKSKKGHNSEKKKNILNCLP